MISLSASGLTRRFGKLVAVNDQTFADPRTISLTEREISPRKFAGTP
jgi:hypothetical protein